MLETKSKQTESYRFYSETKICTAMVERKRSKKLGANNFKPPYSMAKNRSKTENRKPIT